MIGRQWKICVLCSGGLDSVIALRRAQQEVGEENVLGLWVDLNHPYARKEQSALSRLGLLHTAPARPWTKKHPVIIQHYGLINSHLFANEPTPDDQIIPGRNMLLATMAAAYAPEVWLAALYGEMHTRMVDKNEQFFQLATATLSYTFGRSTVVKTPFANKTKAAALREALIDGTISRGEVEETSTCYDPVRLRCGECSACRKRAIACELAGVIEQYDTDPFAGQAAGAYYQAHASAWVEKDFSHYNLIRCQETLLAYEKAAERRRAPP